MADALDAIASLLSVMSAVLASPTAILIVSKAVFPDATLADRSSRDVLLASAVPLSV